jgi:hypothetical protein
MLARIPHSLKEAMTKSSSNRQQQKVGRNGKRASGSDEG